MFHCIEFHQQNLSEYKVSIGLNLRRLCNAIVAIITIEKLSVVKVALFTNTLNLLIQYSKQISSDTFPSLSSSSYFKISSSTN